MPSHAHLSDFLDRLTYEHALSGGAMHGGYTGPFRHQEFQRTWLEQHWHRATVGSGVLWEADANDNDHPLYVRPGQALAWSHGCGIAVRDGAGGLLALLAHAPGARAVATELEVSPALVHFYFGSRQTLVDAAWRSIMMAFVSSDQDDVVTFAETSDWDGVGDLVRRIFSPEDGQRMGLAVMVNTIIRECDRAPLAPTEPSSYGDGNPDAPEAPCSQGSNVINYPEFHLDGATGRLRPGRDGDLLDVGVLTREAQHALALAGCYQRAITNYRETSEDTNESIVTKELKIAWAEAYGVVWQSYRGQLGWAGRTSPG